MDEKYVIKITWEDGMTLYINRDPAAPENPMDLGFGWETTGKISNAWETSNKAEASTLLVKWKHSMPLAFAGKGAVTLRQK